MIRITTYDTSYSHKTKFKSFLGILLYASDCMWVRKLKVMEEEGKAGKALFVLLG